jgi:methionyl-tRNA formyltransferase
MTDVAFLGGKDVGARCLEYLVARMNELDCRISAILPTPQGAKVRDLAEKHGLPIASTIDDLPECDVLISVQYHQILRRRDIQKARAIAVNLHMAPLPEYRGCNQFSLAIINGDKEFGVTVHQLDEGIDSGPVIAERRFPIPDCVWVDELVNIATDESVELFQESIESIVRGTFDLTEQSQLVPARGTSLNFRKDIEPLRQLDLNWDATKLGRYIRALSMPGFEPPYAVLKNGEKIFFHRDDQHDQVS